MQKRRYRLARTNSLLCLFSISLIAVCRTLAEPTPPALSGFNAYAAAVEARLARQHQSQEGFLAAVPNSIQSDLRVRRGEFIIENLTPSTATDLPGALLHDWRGTAFVPGGRAAAFERLLKDFNAYPRIFAPQVVAAKITAGQDDDVQASMRVRQKHVITVVMDTSYNITFRRLDEQHGYSVSRSSSIREIDAPGTDRERALSVNEDHGFLWRMNNYWTWEERAGGLYIQIESISLSRSIPAGLGWLIRPFVESVPRESLEFTLHAACDALRTSSN